MLPTPGLHDCVTVPWLDFLYRSLHQVGQGRLRLPATGPLRRRHEGLGERRGWRGAANTDRAVAVADMSDGQVRKIDKDSKKITLKHGDIKNLDMPGMTMVLQVKGAAMLDSVKPGDKVKFKAEKSGSALMLTDLQVIR